MSPDRRFALALARHRRAAPEREQKSRTRTITAEVFRAACDALERGEERLARDIARGVAPVPHERLSRNHDDLIIWPPSETA